MLTSVEEPQRCEPIADLCNEKKGRSHLITYKSVDSQALQP
jgi:hypothetical protein